MAKLKVRFRGVIEVDPESKWGNNKIRIINPGYYHRLVNKFQKGETVWLTIENEKSQRSLKQNGLYWLYVTCIAEHTGHTQEEIHEYCKMKFLPKRAMNVGLEILELPGSTSILSKGEFVELTMNVQAFAGSLGIELPDPKDVGVDFV